MKWLKFLLVLVVVTTFTSCKDSGSSSNYDTELTTTDEDGNEVYPDGTYCADIDYYNPDTGTRSTYTLNVEVENNEVTVIYWPNGGWLDDSHFSPEELDSNGSCSFTSDKGYEYDIQITGSECSYTDELKAQRDSEEDQEAVTCPECGGDKSEYDDYCYFCKRKFTCPECGGKKYRYDDVCDECKDKAEHTCKRCGQHDSFMWSSDDLCSDCKRDEENEN